MSLSQSNRFANAMDKQRVAITINMWNDDCTDDTHNLVKVKFKIFFFKLVKCIVSLVFFINKDNSTYLCIGEQTISSKQEQFTVLCTGE